MSDGISAVQHGGGWITNVGNAFLDLGSMWAIRTALDRDVRLTLSSSFPRWTAAKLKRGPLSFFGSDASASNVFDTAAAYDADYLVRSGACLSDRWFDRHGEVLERAAADGTRLVFHGVGFSDWSYDDPREIERVREWLRALDPYAVVTRDEATYRALDGIAEHTYDGIDCGFFLDEVHDPVPTTDEYVALNFDKRPEVEAARSAAASAVADGGRVVRPHHSFWYPWDARAYPRMIEQYYGAENVFVSDVPEEYLNVYGNVTQTHADRVHACVATLVFGSPARLYTDTPRSALLERIGHGDVTERLTAPDSQRVEREKENQLAFLRSVLQ